MTALLPQEIIRRKRDGHALTADQINVLAQGISDGSMSEGQIAAFAMAVYFQGLTRREQIALTMAMESSGETLDWQDKVDGPVLDKHSTGGVGDKVSLILAPLIAACGGYVPMISGRGLGHTGGTLDKLDSIPGYDTTPSLVKLRQVVCQTGCVIVGQNPELVPADRRFYAIRDVTATVEAPGLIVASILSKKMAAGLNGLVLDVKTGSGAFMADYPASLALAEALVAVANGAGLPTAALITDMDQVLGTSAGNALEVRESIDFLTGKYRDSRLYELILALGGKMLLLGGLADNQDQAYEKLAITLNNGAAAEVFARMVAALGGPSDLLDVPDDYLPKAKVIRPVHPETPGIVTGMATRDLGLTVIGLGGGRRRVDDKIDYAVGLSDIAPIGTSVDTHRPLLTVHAASEAAAERVVTEIRAAISVGERPAGRRPLIHRRLEPTLGEQP